MGPPPGATSKIFTITDMEMKATNYVMAAVVFESGKEAAILQCRAAAGNKEFTLLVTSLRGTASGLFKINYLFGE